MSRKGLALLSGFAGVVIGALGFGLLVRRRNPLEAQHPANGSGRRRTIEIHKTMNVAAPLERVFKVWTYYENFPRLISNIREVKSLGNGRSHWVLAGSTSTPMEWDAAITRLIPNKELAWKSVPGSVIENTGVVRFRSNADGSTRIDLRISYSWERPNRGHRAKEDPGSSMVGKTRQGR